jgi:glucokinase
VRIVAGDIGGTKTVLAIFDQTASGLRSIREQAFPCADFPSLEAVLDAFLRERDHEALVGACFGVAGPVVDGVAKITNLPWVIDTAKLSAKLGGLPVRLLNDLQSTALGTLALGPESFAELQPGKADPTGTIAVIAPGTGLGEAMLLWDGARYISLPSEGGHADFAPGTDDEIDLLHYLRKLHGHHISYERVLSGPGIGDLYGFVRGKESFGFGPEPVWLAQQIATGDRNAVVATAAVDNKDPACVKALQMFAEILGAEAGNVALRGMATGGVVIGGGIPPKILPVLQAGGLVQRFNDKGRFSNWTKALGLRVTLEPRASLLGAAHYVATSKDHKS